jgi:hypothetical protein
MREDDYDLGINKGFFSHGDYMQWCVIKNIKANMQKMIAACGDNCALYNSLTRKALKPVVDKVAEGKIILNPAQIAPDDEIMEMFADVGTLQQDRTEESIIKDLIDYTNRHIDMDFVNIYNNFISTYGYKPGKKGMQWLNIVEKTKRGIAIDEFGVAVS